MRTDSRLTENVLCCKCGGKGRVKDSRVAPGSVRRRRECCGDSWTTYEVSKQSYFSAEQNAKGLGHLLEQVRKIQRRAQSMDSALGLDIQRIEELLR